MEHFIELFLELLFGFSKDSPKEMPNIEYLDNYVIKHNYRKTLSKACITLIVIINFSLLWIFIKHETRFLFLGFMILFSVLFILSIYALSFKCSINDNEIFRTNLWLFKTKVNWSDIQCIRVVENTNEKYQIIALYNQNGKCILDFNTDMDNAWYLVKTAEHLSIKIRYEKDLSLKQLNHI